MFRKLAEELGTKAFKDTPCILVFFYDKLICYKYGESIGYESLDLTEYHENKEIAHSLVFYSIKHNKKYSCVNELCEKLQLKLLSPFNSGKEERLEYMRNASVETLMRDSCRIFLNELHRITQDFKQKAFNNVWPSPLVAFVVGPASPRVGHPAMQYFGRLSGHDVTPMNFCHPLIDKASDTTSMVSNKFYRSSPCEMEIKIGTKYNRYLYYVENPTNLVQALKIGLSLYVEETVFSKYKNMQTDILAKDSHDRLNDVCNFDFEFSKSRISNKFSNS
jgi:hypothetical protein